MLLFSKLRKKQLNNGISQGETVTDDVKHWMGKINTGNNKGNCIF
jgi:hypothetical protein